MKNVVMSLTLAIVASGAAFVCQPAAADTDTVTVKQVEQGPATVIDSWMQPTVVRSRAIKDSDGTTETVHEPLIMERHERVVVPETETTTTTTVEKPQPTVVRTEQRAVAYRAGAAAPVKKKRHSVRHSVRHHRKAKPRTVARRPVQKRNFVASKVTVEEKVQSPTVIEQTEQRVIKEKVIERRHPALEYN